MAGITHLSDIYEKNGIEFVRELFANPLVISEKLDGSSFSVMKKDGKINYYNRNERQPLSKVDRTIIGLYEPAIKHIESLSPDIFDENMMYGFEYFFNTKPVEIEYDRLPKNNLVLTNIKEFQDGKMKQIITDPTILNKKADDFDVERPSIIFDGKLDSSQVDGIQEFLETSFDELVSKFNTDSFTKYIVSILNPSLKSTGLRDSTENPIEGLVLKFDDNGKEIFAKIVDPVFTQMARNKAKARREKPTDDTQKDNTKELLNKYASFATDMMKNITVEGDGESERFLNVLYQTIHQFILKNKSYVDGLNLEQWSDDPLFHLNSSFNVDKDIQGFINSNADYKQVFQKLITTFKKEKKRAGMNFTKDDVAVINGLVQLINKTIQPNSFKEHFYFADDLYLLEKTTFEDYDGKGGVALYNGRFQPPTKAHIQIIENALKTFDKVIVSVVRGEKSDPKKNPFSKELQTEILKDVFGDRVELESFTFGFLPFIIDKSEYDIEAILAGSDRVDGYEKMLKNSRNKEHDDIAVLEIPRTGEDISASKLRQGLIDDDEEAFRANSDKRTWKYYDKLREEIL